MTLPQHAPYPPIPRFDQWGPAVLSSEVLRGTLVSCGPGYRLAAWPDTPRVRAHALAPWLATPYLAVGPTAAWIWGACRDPGRPLHVATVDGRRAPRHIGTDRTVRQLRLQEKDVVELGLVTVTTPLRTVFDLLRAPGEFGAPGRITCRILLSHIPAGGESLRERLARGGRPFRRVALDRLSACGY